MPRPQIDSLADALAYIVTLEDALKPFAPFAVASAVPMSAELKNVTQAEVYALKRDTAHFDMAPFHRAAELTRGLV